MSSLSNSIEQLKKYSEQKDLEAKWQLLEAITRQEQNLQKQLTADMQSFRDDLERQKQAIQKDLIRLYKVPFWIIIGIGVVLIIALAYLTNAATNQYMDMREWKQSAALYKENSKGLMLANCNLADKTSKICIQVDPQYNNQVFGDNQDYRIIKLGKN